MHGLLSRRMVATFALVLLSFGCGKCPAHADAVTRFKQRITRMLVREHLSSAQVGVYVRILGDGRVLYARNADTPFTPASNFKLITTVVALSVLGPKFRFTTELLGPQVNAYGIVDGNLYLRGNGDPTMVEPWTRPATAPFERFAVELRRCGIRRVSGALVGDDSAFDRDFIGKGWLRRYLLVDYAAETAALSINGNLMHLDVRPDKVTAYPSTSALQYRRVRGAGGFAVTRGVGSSCVLIHNCKPGRKMEASLTVHNPSAYTTGVLEKLLLRHGVSFGAAMRLVRDDEVPLPAAYVRYARHESMPLLQIIKRINKHSDNLLADHVFKAIGWKRYGRGTLENSARALKEYLASSGVDTTGIEIADGCGLSVLDRVTPRQFVELLDHVACGANANLFKSTLAIAGREGTMRGRLSGLPVRAKTGTIDGACTLSGYVTTKAGQQVCFSILVNHQHVSNNHVRWTQDQIVKCIALLNERV